MICKDCNTTFKPSKNDKRIKFCSNKCGENYHNRPEMRNTLEKRYAKAKAACSRKSVINNPKKQFNLTLEQFTEIYQDGLCYYCEDTIGYSGVGLDRKNNDLPYNPDNVLPCCGDCNKFRSDRLTVQETKYLIKKLKGLRKGGPW